MSYIFMSCHLVRQFHVRHFHVQHFQRSPRWRIDGIVTTHNSRHVWSGIFAFDPKPDLLLFLAFFLDHSTVYFNHCGYSRITWYLQLQNYAELEMKVYAWCRPNKCIINITFVNKRQCITVNSTVNWFCTRTVRRHPETVNTAVVLSTDKL